MFCKRGLLLSCFVVFFSTSFAQDNTRDSIDYSIRLNPYRLFEGTFSLSVEKTINSGFSLEVTGLGTYTTTGGFGNSYLKAQEFSTVNSEGILTSYNAQMISGFGVQVMPKFYLYKDVLAPIGGYAAPMLMYRKYWIEGNSYYFIPDNHIFRNLDVYAVGVLLGGKVPIAKVYNLDFYFGGVFRLSKYGGEDKFTQYTNWTNLDYSGVMPTAGLSFGILK